MASHLLLLVLGAGLASGLFAAQIQNCAGSQCNQDNVGFGAGFPASRAGFGGFGGGATQKRKKREAQVQNCQGSQCNQNNGGVFVGFGAGFPFFGAGFGGGATQNCIGSSCNQNNGRKKREAQV